MNTPRRSVQFSFDTIQEAQPRFINSYEVNYMYRTFTISPIDIKSKFKDSHFFATSICNWTRLNYEDRIFTDFKKMLLRVSVLVECRLVITTLYNYSNILSSVLAPLGK
ncbi:hypothetical protein V8C43DRAFT_276833 [Trichoderma afarasin]